jgi:hypothetical protein
MIERKSTQKVDAALPIEASCVFGSHKDKKEPISQSMVRIIATSAVKTALFWNGMPFGTMPVQTFLKH